MTIAELYRRYWTEEAIDTDPRVAAMDEAFPWWWNMALSLNDAIVGSPGSQSLEKWHTCLFQAAKELEWNDAEGSKRDAEDILTFDNFASLDGAVFLLVDLWRDDLQKQGLDIWFVQVTERHVVERDCLAVAANPNIAAAFALAGDDSIIELARGSIDEQPIESRSENTRENVRLWHIR